MVKVLCFIVGTTHIGLNSIVGTMILQETQLSSVARSINMYVGVAQRVKSCVYQA